jgi:hypothetical protein
VRHSDPAGYEYMYPQEYLWDRVTRGQGSIDFLCCAFSLAPHDTEWLHDHTYERSAFNEKTKEAADDARRDASSATHHVIDLHPVTLRRGCVTAGCSGDPDYDRGEMLPTAEKVKNCELQNSDANQILVGLFLADGMVIEIEYVRACLSMALIGYFAAGWIEDECSRICGTLNGRPSCLRLGGVLGLP